MGQEQSKSIKFSPLGYEADRSGFESSAINNRTSNEIIPIDHLPTRRSCESEVVNKIFSSSEIKVKRTARKYFIFVDQGIELIVPELETIGSSSIAQRRKVSSDTLKSKLSSTPEKRAYAIVSSCHESYLNLSELSTQHGSPFISPNPSTHPQDDDPKDDLNSKPQQIQQINLDRVSEDSAGHSSICHQAFEHRNLDLGSLLGI